MSGIRTAPILSLTASQTSCVYTLVRVFLWIGHGCWFTNRLWLRSLMLACSYARSVQPQRSCSGVFRINTMGRLYRPTLQMRIFNGPVASLFQGGEFDSTPGAATLHLSS